jgi:hypothetical protein
MTEYYDPDDDLFSYEDFEDIDNAAWDPDALEPIDLAELDSEDDLEAPSDAAEELLERIETLDDEIPARPPEPSLADPRLVDDARPGEEVELPADDEPGEDTEFLEDEAPDADEPPEETPPPQARTIRIGGRGRMQRLPLGPPPARSETAPREAEPPAEPDYVYRLALALPLDLGAEVLELRTLGEIEDMPPPGIDLAFAFRADDLAAVESAIAAWAERHLPLELSLAEIVTEVAGAQQYIAAWHVEPHAALQDVQIALRRALAPLVAPLAEGPVAFQPRIVIGAHVPARTYPLVIGQMQRDFAPFAWHVASAALFRAEASADPGAWELARAFGPPAGRE